MLKFVVELNVTEVEPGSDELSEKGKVAWGEVAELIRHQLDNHICHLTKLGSGTMVMCRLTEVRIYLN